MLFCFKLPDKGYSNHSHHRVKVSSSGTFIKYTPACCSTTAEEFLSPSRVVPLPTTNSFVDAVLYPFYHQFTAPWRVFLEKKRYSIVLSGLMVVGPAK
jgi:hypothetical protein